MGYWWSYEKQELEDGETEENVGVLSEVNGCLWTELQNEFHFLLSSLTSGAES